MLDLHEELQRPMYDLAMQGLEQFIANNGGFTPFAVLMLPDHQMRIIETSGEFDDCQSACDAILSELTARRASGDIIGSLLCAPIEVPAAALQAGAVIDIEAEGMEPVQLLRQIQNASGVATLSDIVTRI
jgi:hypothetical protein